CWLDCATSASSMLLDPLVPHVPAPSPIERQSSRGGAARSCIPAAPSMLSSYRTAPLGDDLDFRLVEDLAHRCQPLLDADRLALEAVESSGHDSRLVLGHHRGRDRDDWGWACDRIGSQFLEGFDAVDAR